MKIAFGYKMETESKNVFGDILLIDFKCSCAANNKFKSFNIKLACSMLS